MTASIWELSDSTARLATGALQAEIDVAHPQAGLRRLRLGGGDVAGRLFAAPLLPTREVNLANPSAAEHYASAEPVSEAYVRQADLVATYPQTPERPYRVQLDWRALEPRESLAAGGVELIVSTQTSLLDSHPEVSVYSSLAAVELWRVTNLDQLELKQIPLQRGEPLFISHEQGPGCFLWRLLDKAWSYVEMLPPSDYHSTIIAPDAEFGISARHRLFVRFLEKGVILRSRVRGCFVPRAKDAVSAVECYRALLASELPLTT